MDGQATPTLYAWSLAAAGTHDRRDDSMFLRPPHQLGMRMRRRHIWAGVDRIVQPGNRSAPILSYWVIAITLAWSSRQARA